MIMREFMMQQKQIEPCKEYQVKIFVLQYSEPEVLYF